MIQVANFWSPKLVFLYVSQLGQKLEIKKMTQQLDPPWWEESENAIKWVIWEKMWEPDFLRVDLAQSVRFTLELINWVLKCIEYLTGALRLEHTTQNSFMFVTHSRKFVICDLWQLRYGNASQTHTILYEPGGTVGYPAQPGLTWRNHKLPSPTRINLEEPGRVASLTRIILEEPGRVTQPNQD